MSDKKFKILYVDDNPMDRALVTDSLVKEHGGFDLTVIGSKKEFEEKIGKTQFDVVLSDFNILGFEGSEVMKKTHELDPDVPVIIVTGTGSESIAVDLMKQGAFDYVIKTPSNIKRLSQVISSALELKAAREAKRALEKDLLQIEWMLSDKPIKNESEYFPEYGDLSELNKSGLILGSVGKEHLRNIVSDYLDLLETSSAIYELNGDYALGLFVSGWCQLMDSASRKLCKTDDNVVALNSGKWLCHESCWKDASKKAIDTGLPVDIQCEGGINLFAVPIRTGGEIKGAINFGYGAPPREMADLKILSDKYKIPVDELLRESKRYQKRPPFVIELAKKQLQRSAQYLGRMIELRETEESLKIAERRYSDSQAIGHVGNWEYQLETDKFWGSDEARRIYGLDNDAFSFTTEEVESCIPERERVHCALIDLIERDKKYDLEFDIVTRDKGIKKTIHSMAVAEKNIQGQVTKVSGIIIDITDRKNAEAELVRIKDLLNETEETGNIGGWIFDPVTMEQKWTDQVFRILEIDLDHGAPKVPEGLDFVDPSFRPMAEEAVGLAVQKGEPYSQEWIVTTARGNKKWVQAIAHPKLKDGKVVSISGSFQDITERKSAEEELKAANQQLSASEQQLRAANQQLVASEQQLRAANQQLKAIEQQLKSHIVQLEDKNKFIDKIIESSALSTWISDEEGTAVRTNPACLEFFGAKEEEIVGKYNLFKDEVLIKSGFIPELKTVFEKGKAASIVIDYNFGEVQHFSVEKAVHKVVNSIFTPILDDRGNVKNVIVQTIDLTEIKKAESEIQKRERKLLKVFDASPFPSAMVDLKDENIFYWSRSAINLFGHTAPTTSEWYRIAYPDPVYREGVIKRWGSVLEEAKRSKTYVNAGEFNVTCSDGSVLICELYAMFITDNLIVTFNDITNKKRAREELKKYHIELEDLVKERTGELEQKNSELQRYFDAFVERELRMKELYDENESLKKENAKLIKETGTDKK